MSGETKPKQRHTIRLDAALDERLMALARQRSITGRDTEIQAIKTNILAAGIEAIVEKLEAESHAPHTKPSSSATVPRRAASGDRAKEPLQPAPDRRTWPIEELDPDDDEPAG